MAKAWSVIRKRKIWGVMVLLVAIQVASVFATTVAADEPDASGPTATPTLAVTVETQPDADDDGSGENANGEPGPAVAITPTVTMTSTLVIEPAIQPAVTATLTLPASPTPTFTPTFTPTATATPSQTPPPVPTPTLTPTPPGTAHIAVLTSETVLPVGEMKNSEIFIALRDVQPGVRGFELHVSFDPAVVQIVDVDDSPANGVQIAAAAFFGSAADGAQKVAVNQVNNETGEIILALEQPDGLPVSDTDEWQRVATITWVAQAEGKSVIAIDGSTQFITADERRLPADATYNGVVFVRAPGKIEGTIHLQGRTTHHGASVSSVLVAARVDRAHTGEEGRFAITTSHGEGFYTLMVSMPGYLTAESDRPVKVTMDSVISAGKVMLLGGDVNGDNCVDVRDLSYVAWHFDAYDAGADVNGDGVVDISDLTLTASNFGQRGPTTWQVPNQDN